jgi:hypothetical protein
LTTQNTENNNIPEVNALIASATPPSPSLGNSAASGGESLRLVTSKEGMIGPEDPEFDVWSEWLRNRRSDAAREASDEPQGV